MHMKKDISLVYYLGSRKNMFTQSQPRDLINKQGTSLTIPYQQSKKL